MSSLPRFFSEHPIDPPHAVLDGAEHQHLSKVMRLQAGDQVTLFDGLGKEFLATIRGVGRRSTELTIDEVLPVDRELTYRLRLAVALPKGDRQQWLIEKAVELGVDTVIPLTTARGVAQPHGKSLTRLRKWVIAASKQCGRNRLMKIETPHSVASICSEGNSVLAHPSENAEAWSSFLSRHASRTPLSILIGPEGGFTQEEVDQASASGCPIVTLGPRVLRIETAAVGLVASLVLGDDSGE